MRRPVPPHRVARHHLMVRRPPPGRDAPLSRFGGAPARLSDLILALLGVALLGAVALMAAAAAMARVVAA